MTTATDLRARAEAAASACLGRFGQTTGPSWEGIGLGGNRIEATVERLQGAVTAALLAFAAEAVREEREACARIAENYDYEDAYERIRARTEAP